MTLGSQYMRCMNPGTKCLCLKWGTFIITQGNSLTQLIFNLYWTYGSIFWWVTGWLSLKEEEGIAWYLKVKLS